MRGNLYFDDAMLEWPDKVRHVGNFIDTTCTDYIDCIANKSYFNGYVNKLKPNFEKMTHNVLINLFKSLCCSLYSSPLGSVRQIKTWLQLWQIYSLHSSMSQSG